jgi:DNA-binding winged helix-turn-helix (wHTH) protein/Flp pilus assembly protein TadD
MEAATFRRSPERVATKLRFGAFEVDLEQRELRKSGLRVRLQEKPFQILELLLRADGHLVTRKELAAALWPSLHVSFDQGLNTAVNALRQALGDSSKSCRYIETRSGLGYRFVAPVEKVLTPVPNADSTSPRIGQATREETGERSEAHHEYLKGRHFLERMTEAGTRKSIAYFESAVSQDSNHSLALSGMADAYGALAILNVLPPHEARPKVERLVSAALEGNPDAAETHLSVALLRRTFYWDWEGSISALERASDLNPRCASIHRELALQLCACGTPQAAVNFAAKALEPDPLSLANNAAYAWVLYLAGNYVEAQQQCWKTLALDAALPSAQHTLGLAYEQLGLVEEAITEFENARRCWDDNPAAVAALAHIYGVSALRDEAHRTIDELKASSRNRYVSPYWFAIAQAGLGNVGFTLEALEQSLEERDVWLIWMCADPRLKALRVERRFERIARDVGLKKISSAQLSAISSQLIG